MCACLFGVSQEGKCYFFPAGAAGQAEGLGVRGQAGTGRHTAPLCSLAAGLNEMLFPSQG